MTQFEQAALRLYAKHDPLFSSVCQTFEKDPSYTQEFLSLHEKRDKILEKIASKQPLVDADKQLSKQLDKTFEDLVKRAPDGLIHGYLISIGHLNVLNPDPFEWAAKSVFYQKDPTFFHESTKFFAKEQTPLFFSVREILMVNPIFTDAFKLYYDRAQNYKPGDKETQAWLEEMYQRLRTISSDLSLIWKDGQHVKDTIVTYHQKIFPEKKSKV